MTKFLFPLLLGCVSVIPIAAQTMVAPSHDPLTISDCDLAPGLPSFHQANAIAELDGWSVSTNVLGGRHSWNGTCSYFDLNLFTGAGVGTCQATAYPPAGGLDQAHYMYRLRYSTVQTINGVQRMCYTDDLWEGKYVSGSNPVTIGFTKNDFFYSDSNGNVHKITTFPDREVIEGIFILQRRRVNRRGGVVGTWHNANTALCDFVVDEFFGTAWVR